ncbi:MAG TPA: hypothetical protein VF420_13300 [Casimicrobiaceae bacterium]
MKVFKSNDGLCLLVVAKSEAAAKKIAQEAARAFGRTFSGKLTEVSLKTESGHVLMVGNH